MKSLTLDAKKIDTLRDLPDMIPVFREFYEDWTVRVFNREEHECRNYLSPNRRDFYKILLITKGIGIFTTGLNAYYIDKPTILFIHPNDIISWRNLSPSEVGGYYVLFKKDFVFQYSALKAAMDKYGLFTQPHKQVVRLAADKIHLIDSLFERMKAEELANASFNEDAIQAYLQLLLVESARHSAFAQPDPWPVDVVHDDYQHIYQFFQHLEQEAAQINYDRPIRLKTAKEFAADLAIHPNYLNALLKKYTGENVSSHIKSRLLEEAKVLLLQTDWTLQEIGASIGFAEQSNFSLFFKKNTGLTPAAFRKSRQAG